MREREKAARLVRKIIRISRARSTDYYLIAIKKLGGPEATADLLGISANTLKRFAIVVEQTCMPASAFLAASMHNLNVAAMAHYTYCQS
jgi:hypothetical protein